MDTMELVRIVVLSSGGAAAVVAGLAGWLGKVWFDRLLQSQKFVGDIDADLRKRRIDAYVPLWKLTSLLPQWPRATDVTYEQLQGLSQQLRTWYYEVGGIYLSRSTHRDAYSKLQDALKQLGQASKSGVVSEADYNAVRLHCSRLRTFLANDIESRREGPILESAGPA